MTRSYRWNLEYAAAAEPERCEHCREFAATVQLQVERAWGSWHDYVVCDDCLKRFIEALQLARLRFDVVRLNTSED